MRTTVVNIRNLPANWQRDPSYVYIGRAGHGQSGYFGNPFRLSAAEPRGSTIARYHEWFQRRLANDPEFATAVGQLRGKKLVCFCHPLACHGDVIAAHLETSC